MLLKISSLCTTHKSSVSTGFTEQIMPILRILCYNGSLMNPSQRRTSLNTTSQSYITTDGQSASLSWYQGYLGLMTRFFHCQTIAGFLYGAPSLTRGRVCLLQSTIYNTFYCLRFETRSLYLYPPGTGWPGYTPRHWVKLSLNSSSPISLCVYICILFRL
jgi:hypothetical protein